MSNAIKPFGTGSDEQALALKMYSGLAAEAPRTSVFLWGKDMPFCQKKTVTSGKSWQFFMEGNVPDAEEFVPGDEMLGQNYALDEGTITSDKYVVSHTFVPKDQMAIGHYDIMPKLARKHMYAINRKYDKRVFVVAALGARTAAVTKNGLSIHSGGNRVTRTGGTNSGGAAVITSSYALSNTGASNFRADARLLGYYGDVDNLDGQSRYMFIDPYIKQVLLNDTSNQLFSRDFKSDGVDNDINKNVIGKVEGWNILGTPNTTSNGGPLPNQVITDSVSKYSGDFSVGASNGCPVAIGFSASNDGAAGIGIVTFEEVQHFVVYQPEKLGWLVGSYILCGAGLLNPWCLSSVEVIT